MLNEPNWAEILEAIATAVAALGAIISIWIAWKSIKKDIEEQNKNIITLTGVVTTLSKQTEALNESMKIDSKILNELTKHFADSKDMRKIQEERERLEIMPKIKVVFSHVQANKIYAFRIINDGFREALNLKIAKTQQNEEDYEIRLSCYEKDKLLTINDAIGGDVNNKKYGQKNLPNEIGTIKVEYENIHNEKFVSLFHINYNVNRLIIKEVEI